MGCVQCAELTDPEKKTNVCNEVDWRIGTIPELME